MARKILVNIEATPSCPAQCSMCPRDLVTDKGFISIQAVERIVSQISPDFVWEVDLAGRGEPTLHPQFPALLKIMRSSGILTDLTTTAVAMTPANITACADNVDVIRLSVSSLDPETFGKVHIGLDHARIWRNIEALAEAAADKVIVHLTGGPVIYDHLPQTVERLRTLGYRNFRLLPLWNRGGSVESQMDNERRTSLMRTLKIDASEAEYSGTVGRFSYLLHTLGNAIRNPAFCPVGDSSIFINYEGTILGCIQDFGGTSVLGNIWDNTISEIVESRVKSLGRMPVCTNCNTNRAALKSQMFNLLKPRIRLPKQQAV
jgi:MoaA/NifB/PqqE/SkfB family radical SAM enzyme